MSKNSKYALYMVFFFSYSFIGLFFVLVFNGEYNEPFYFAFKYLSIPFIIICYAVLSFEFRAKKVTFSGVLYTLFCFCVLTIFGSGYLAFFNNKVGAQEACAIEGKVIKSETSKHKHGVSYYLTILEIHSKKEMKFEVQNYNQLTKYPIGSNYSKTWYKGSLGLLYR
jgi:hypothetical protein